MKIVMGFQPGFGHWSRLGAIAEALEGRGHEVVLATSAAFAARLGRPALPVGPDWIEDDCLAEPAGDGLAVQAGAIAERFFGGAPGVAGDLMARCARRPPDLFIFDYTLFGGPPAAHRLGVPWASVYGLSVPFRPAGWPPFGSELAPAVNANQMARHAALNRRVDAENGELYRPVIELWRAAGVSLPTPWQAYRDLPRLGIVGSVAGADFPWRRPPPATIAYVGPLLPEPSECPADPELEAFIAAGEGPLIHISLGLAFSRNLALLGLLVETARRQPWRAVVSTGRLPPAAAGAACPRLLVRETTDHARLFPRLDAVICHGGANTLMRALAAGVPALVIPLGAEQRSNGARFRHAGIGDRILPSEATRETVAARLTALLAPAVRPRCRALSAEAFTAGGAGRAADLIEKLGIR